MTHLHAMGRPYRSLPEGMAAENARPAREGSAPGRHEWPALLRRLDRIAPHYPAHRHRAEELYFVLAGSGTFRLDGHPPARQAAGAVVHVPSQLVHRITMDTEPMVVLYLWRGGDLREKSTFV